MTCRNRTRYKIVRGVVILASVRTMRKGFMALARYPGAVMVRIHKTPSSWEWGPVWWAEGQAREGGVDL